MGIIVKPLVTEKQTKITEKFGNRYGFVVLRNADKSEIKKAQKKVLEAIANNDAAEAKNAIDLSSYNDSVRSFLKEYSHFPTPQLASISGVEMPKFFS